MNTERFTLTEDLLPNGSAKAVATGSGETVVLHDQFGFKVPLGSAAFACNGIVVWAEMKAVEIVW